MAKTTRIHLTKIGLAWLIFTFFLSVPQLLTQEKSSATEKETLGREEEENEVPSQYLENLGGDLGKKLEAANPDIFTADLSPLQRARLIMFYLPKADAKGYINRDENFNAWRELKEREARQAGKSFSVSDPIQGAMSSAGGATPEAFGTGSTAQNLINWTNIGPMNAGYSGRIGVGAIAVHPTDPNTVYVGGAGGGVWKTTNGGTSWAPLTDNLPTQACGALAIDPGNPNTVYYGSGDILMGGAGSAGLYKTSDGGSSWVLLTPYNLWGVGTPLKIVIDPTNSQRIFVVSYFTIMRSSDAGASWTKVLDMTGTGGNTSGQVWDMVMNPRNPNVLLAMVCQQSTLAGIYKSTDGGSTWRTVTSGLPTPSQIGRSQLAISNSSPNIIVAMMSTTTGGFLGLYKSIDTGDSWSRTGLSFTGYDNGLLGYHNTVSIDPINPNVIFAGSMQLWRTTDGGGSWAASNGLHVDQHALQWSGSVLFAGNDGGIYKSTDLGASWTSLNTNIILTQIYPSIGLDKLNPSTIWCGSQDNGAYQKTSTGWTDRVVSDVTSTIVDYTNSSIVYANALGTFYRTTDAGSTWNPIVNGLIAGPKWGTTPLIQDPQTPNVLYWADTHFYKSTNRGDLWTSIGTLPNAATWIAANPTNSRIMYVGVLGSKVLRTSDGGVSWTPLPAPTDGLITHVVVDPVVPTTIYVTQGSSLGTQHVFRSTDEGGTWTSISGDLPNQVAYSILRDPRSSNVLYLGTDLGVFYTTNGGSNWLHDDRMPSAMTYDIGLTSDSNLVAVTYGRGMFKAPLPSLTTSTSSVTVSAPNGGESYTVGATTSINWTCANINNVKIECSTDAGSTWSTIITSTAAAANSYSWAVPNMPTTQGLLRVSDASNSATSDVSNSFFSIRIAPPAAPTLASPATGSANQSTSPTLSWNTASGASSYRLQLSSSTSFTPLLLDDSTLTTTSRQIGPLSNSSTYYWRVKAKNSGGTSSYSSAQSFSTLAASIAAVSVTSPNGGENWIVGTSQTITWTQTNISNVKIEYSPDNGSTWNAISSSTGASGGIFNWSVPNAATAQALVRVSDAANSATGDVSNGAFSITGLSSPALVSPSDAVTGAGTVLTFAWNSSAGALKYHLQVSTGNSFGSSVWDDTVSTTTSDPLGSLAYGTLYYWRVQSINGGGASPFSNAWSFQTAAAPLPAPALSSPATGSVNQSAVVALSWHSSGSGSIYRLQVSGDSTFGSIMFDSSMTTTSKKIGPLANHSSYYWRVSVSNGGGTSGYSAPWPFSTDYPVFALSSHRIDFGSVLKGTKRKDSVTVGNSGTNTLKVNGVKSSSTKYSVTPTSGSILPGASMKFYITFAPGQISLCSSRIVFTHNALGTRDTVLVSGQGTAVAQALPTIEFGAVKVGTSKTEQFYLYNDGEDSLAISGVVSTNSSFTVTPNSAAVVPFGNLCLEVKAIPHSAERGSGYIVVNYGGDLPPESLLVQTDVPNEVHQAHAGVPGEFSLAQNFPNPFNPTTTIRFDLPERSEVSLKIYNLLGQEIESLFDGELDAGYQTVLWNSTDHSGAAVPSGVYLYRIRTRSVVSGRTFLDVRKMMFAK